MSMERYCIITGEEIKECMGYALARDFNAYLDGKRTDIREISGRGILIIEMCAVKLGIEPFEYLGRFLEEQKPEF